MSERKPIKAAEYRRIVADLCRKEKARIVVEVGVYAGGLTTLLAQVPTVEELHAVDPWTIPYHSSGKEFTQDDMDEVAGEVYALARKHRNIVIHRVRSEVGAANWPDDLPIDFWHTDGNHDYEMVKTDIESWWPHVRPGALMTGDNYEMPSVAKAVDELLPDREIHGKGRVWVWRKPT